MPTPTRADLEAAAVRYFEHMASEQDRPRNFDDDDLDHQIGYEVVQAQEGIELLDVQLKKNIFAGDIETSASRLTGELGIELDALPEDLRLAALTLAARAIREASRLYIHKLTAPAQRFEPFDALFTPPAPVFPAVSATGSAYGRPSASGRSLNDAADEYIEKTRARGVGQSHITELERVLQWLAEVVPPTTPVSAISPDVMKRFRDDLQRLDRRLRGRAVPFERRLTNDASHQIKHVTSSRYWRSVAEFFAWCKAEKLMAESPAEIAKPRRPKGEEPQSPEPFDALELRKLMQAPLYAGYRSVKQVLAPGNCQVRGAHWWSFVLLMHTGMRAGELSQLLPSDFDFDAPIPHLKVSQTDGSGKKVKSVKTKASIRDVPLHPNLLALGLREFVGGRAKHYPDRRLFLEFRPGTNGRQSEGLTRFGGDFLKKAGLWKEGRATHVWRHTFTEFLRVNDVADEDIGAIIGHTASTMTGRYGGKQYPLQRKQKAIMKLDFGFDVVGGFGGPFDPKAHRA